MLGSSPSRMKIMQSIITRPSRICSYSWKTVSTCGSVVRIAAPKKAPRTEPTPPSTAMVTISIECMKPATSGVMNLFCSARSEPESEA